MAKMYTPRMFIRVTTGTGRFLADDFGCDMFVISGKGPSRSDRVLANDNAFEEETQGRSSTRLLAITNLAHKNHAHARKDNNRRMHPHLSLSLSLSLFLRCVCVLCFMGQSHRTVFKQ